MVTVSDKSSSSDGEMAAGESSARLLSLGVASSLIICNRFDLRFCFSAAGGLLLVLC